LNGKQREERRRRIRNRSASALDDQNDEGQVEERGQDATREGKRRVLRAGETTSASGGHHQPAGQGVYHTPDHQLLEDESRVSGRSVTSLCFCLIFTTVFRQKLTT